MSSPLVAIVGSPNVGKSTIFNRIVGKRISIVNDEAGVTRDRLYAKASWLTREFRVVDTGGIELANRPFQEQIRMQVEMAMDEADVIIFIVDGRVGITADDQLVARLLYQQKKPIVLAVNKIDDGSMKDQIHEFYALGLGDPIPVSGVHGIGIGDMLDGVVKMLPDKKDKVYQDEICFCLIGRPNVGKSSLVNAILNQERVIVSNIEGTTRDAIDTSFQREGQPYVIIDTAGLKKRGKIYEAVDKYAMMRALGAVDRSEIVLLVLDAETGILEQDKHVVQYATENHKAIIIVVNKWDAVQKNEKSMQAFTKKIRTEMKFLDYAPIVFVSALKKERIGNILSEIDAVHTAYQTRIPTATLNEVIQDAQIFNPTPFFNGDRLKIYYANQVAICPPTIVLFVNDPKTMHFSYERYLENRLRETFEFSGTPILMICRERK